MERRKSDFACVLLVVVQPIRSLLIEDKFRNLGRDRGQIGNFKDEKLPNLLIFTSNRQKIR